MSIVIYFFLCILSIYFFNRGKVAETLLCLTMMMNNLFGFSMALGESSIKSSDFLIVTSCVIIFIAYRNDSSLFSVKEDSIGKIVLLCFSWTMLVFVGTLILGQETFVNAFKVYRIYLILLFYFVLRRLTLNDVERYIKYVLFFSVIQGIFFYLQLIGITGLLAGYGAHISEGTSLVEHRFGNYPSFAIFYFIYFFIKEKINIYKKSFYLIFFGMMPIIGQMRGVIMAMAISCMVYFLLQRKMKYTIYIILTSMLYSFIVAPMFEKRSEKYNNGTLDEIILIVQDPINIYNNYMNRGSVEGTFAFRIAMYAERIEYMINNPKYSIAGVGCIHEDSPNNRFRFNIGTFNYTLDGEEEKMNTLSSADIAWVGILMRFGFIGVLLFTILFYQWAKNGIPYVRGSTNDIFTVCALQSVCDYLSSYDSAVLGRSNMLTLLFAIAVVVIYINEEKRKLY